MMSREMDVGDLDVDAAQGEAELGAGGGANRSAYGLGGGDRWRAVAEADGELEAGGGAVVVGGGGEPAAPGAYALDGVAGGAQDDGGGVLADVQPDSGRAGQCDPGSGGDPCPDHGHDPAGQVIGGPRRFGGQFAGGCEQGADLVKRGLAVLARPGVLVGSAAGEVVPQLVGVAAAGEPVAGRVHRHGLSSCASWGRARCSRPRTAPGVVCRMVATSS